MFAFILSGCDYLDFNQEQDNTNVITTNTEKIEDEESKLVLEFTYEVNSQEPDWNQLITSNYSQQVEIQSIDALDINMERVGKYTVSYLIEIDGRQEIRKVIVNIVDTERPVLKGITNKTLRKDGSLLPLLTNVSAYDSYDKDIVISLEHININQLDIHTVGQYDVTYVVSDSSGNTTVQTIRVDVIAEIEVGDFEGVSFDGAIEVGNNDVISGTTGQTNRVNIYKTTISQASLMNITSEFPAWIYLFVEIADNQYEKLGGDWASHNLYVGAENRDVYLVVFSSYETNYTINLKTTPIDKTDEIHFIDSHLDSAIKDSLNLVDFNITKSVAQIPTILDLRGRLIENISGIEYFDHLETLYLDDNNISDLSKLVELKISGGFSHGGNISLRNNPLEIKSYEDLKYLDQFINLEFDIIPNFTEAKLVSISDRPNGYIVDDWQRDLYKLENVKNQLVHIQLLSPQYDYNVININFDLFTIKDGKYIPIKTVDGSKKNDIRFGLVYSTYDVLYISVKSYGGSSYTLYFNSEPIDTTSKVVNLDSDLKWRVNYQLFGDKLVPITEQILSNFNVLFMWQQSTTQISYFINVEYLTLEGCNISDLTILKDFTNLKYLSLKDNGLNDISYLKEMYDQGKLEKLVKLDISGNNISSNDPIVIYLSSKGINIIFN